MGLPDTHPEALGCRGDSPEENIDMKRFATCNSAEPTTCLDASKAHILTGRCGRSRHLLYTKESKANKPRAP